MADALASGASEGFLVGVQVPPRPRLETVARTTALIAALGVALSGVGARWEPPPVDARFDYQIGGDYRLAPGVSVVSRDWFAGRDAPGDRYTICYVNAFQTQDDERGVDRPDERSNWPRWLVLFSLGADPNWGGEYLIDLSAPAKRAAALRHVRPMVDRCAAKGFEAVEYDNLDSWTRFDGTPRADDVPFGRRAAVAYAELLTDYAHRRGLAVAQKNTLELGRRAARWRIGFDFAIAEECGRYRECRGYTAIYGDHVIDIEYGRRGFRAACAEIGRRVAVVLRDRDVSTPASARYRYRAC
jgi:Glycoside-hydrolase family GH114